MRLFIVLSFAAFWAAGVSAQTPQPAGAATAAGGVLVGIAGAVPGPVAVASGTFTSSIGPGMPGGVVTGMPYSAEQVTEQVQTLADGTHITQPAQTTRLYRDSQGRTRTERSARLPPGPLGKGVEAPVFIEVSDPVVGVHYSFEPKSHKAHRIKVLMPPPPPPPPPVSANGTRVSKLIQLTPTLRPTQTGAAPPDPTSRPQIARESLGVQNIEGVLAQGSRMTVTYPVGAVGNDKTITTITETWTSPELRMVVLTKSSDPRNGDSTTRLINISRAEPDAALFQVPADYEIVEPQ